MTTSFVPRPIYRVKKYGYVVESGDTPSGIAKKFGRPAGDYRELVAANLYGRTLMPMALGSPYASRTFASLSEGEMLRIPSRWPDVPGLEPGMLSGPPGTLGEDPNTFDPLISGIIAAANAANAGSGGAYSPDFIQAATNAAVQWWHSTQGTAPAADPTQYIPYVTSALGWLNTYGQQILSQAGGPPSITAFPWGAFLGMLPAIPDLTQIDWANGTIPGTNGVPWSSIPWAYLGQLGTALENLKLPPIQWPSDTSVAAVLAAIQAAIKAAQGTGGWTVGVECGSNSHVGTDLQCFCDPGYTWASTTGLDCAAITGPVQPGTPGAQSCPAGGVWDGTAPNGAGCYTCTTGQTYDLASHTCACPAGTTWDSVVNKCAPPAKSQADCVDREVWDAQGPSGPHCYACELPYVYNAVTHQCDCPAGQMWSGTACVPGVGPGPVQKACPIGTTWNAASQVCVQNPPPPPKTTAPPSNVTPDDGMGKTALYAAGAALVVVLGAGGIFLATRPKTPEAKAKHEKGKKK